MKKTPRNLIVLATPLSSRQSVLGYWQPAAILGRVVGVRIDAVDAMSIRAVAHVCGEGFEGLPPAVAHLNTAPSIKLVGAMLRPVAPREHGTPRRVKNRLEASAGMPVRQPVGLQAFKSAPARLRAAVSQVVGSDVLGVAAIAVAEPHNVPTASLANSPGDSDRRQFSEFPTSQIVRLVSRWRGAGLLKRPSSGQTTRNRGCVDHVELYTAGAA